MRRPKASRNNVTGRVVNFLIAAAMIGVGAAESLCISTAAGVDASGAPGSADSLSIAIRLNPAEARLRRPTAIVVDDERSRLFTVNRDSGSISWIDLPTNRVVGEFRIGQRPIDLQRLGSADGELIAVDAARSELIVLRPTESESNGAQMTIVARHPVAADPRTIAVGPGGRWASVASRWSRRMTFVDLAELEAPRTRSRVDMPFAPHLQCLSPDDRRLFVADAFGGELAVVDTDRCELVAARTVRASNIRGMAIDRGGENLLLAHQIVHRDRTTTEEGVHWGGVLSNVVRTLPIRLLVPTDIHERATAAANSNDDQQSASPVDDLFYLGHPDRAAGDPSATIETREGRRIVLFTGVNEVGISDIGANYYTPLAVGRCPSSMVLSRDESRLYVAATFDDAIDVIDVPARRKIARIELGSVRSLTAAEQGEALFHDASLASDGWYSCHSCHTDGHSNGALNDNFGDESYGAPKRIPTLGGVAQTGPWAWSGGLATLEGQIRKSIEITMQGAPPSDSQVAALAAYLRSLPPAPSVSEARRDAALREARRPDASTGDLAAALIGERLFRRIGCAECHAPPHYTTPETYDVGFEDELGNRRFNPPSLLGVSQRRRLLHDGRAASVRDLLERLRHEIGDGDATPDELNELIRFVEGL